MMHRILTLAAVLALPASGQFPVPPPAPPEPAAEATQEEAKPAKPSIQKLAENRYQVGDVTFDSKTREIRFPAQINMTDGALEYLIVHHNGKVHESLLSTGISAIDLNLAFTLLHYKPSRELIPLTSDTGGAFNEFHEVPEDVKAAARVAIDVEWDDAGKTRRVPINDWIQHVIRTTTMPAGPWIYGGSDFYNGRFSAESTGDIAAIFLAPSALLSYPGVDFANDEVWTPFPKRVPEIGTKVTVIITPYSSRSSTKQKP